MQCYFLWFSRFPFLIQEAGEEVSLHKKVRHWKCMEIQQPQEPQWSLTSAQMQENSGKKKIQEKSFHEWEVSKLFPVPKLCNHICRASHLV